MAYSDDSKMFHLVLSWGIGFGIYSILGLCLALCHAVYAPVLAISVIGIIFISKNEYKPFIENIQSLFEGHRVSAEIIAFIVLLFVYLLLAMSPPSWYDALAYHVALPLEYINNHGITRDTENLYRIFPPAMSILYMYSISLGSEFLPKLLHMFFLLLTVACLYSWIDSLKEKKIASLSVLLFVSQWLVQHEVQRADVDFHYTFYSFTSFVLVIKSIISKQTEKESTKKLFLVGVFIGMSMASKLQSLSPLLATETIIAMGFLTKRISIRCIIYFHLAIFLIYLPILIKNIGFTGDPALLVAPKLFSHFSNVSPLELERFEKIHLLKDLFGIEKNPTTFILTPLLSYFEGTYPSTNFDAFITPFYLISLVIGLILSLKNVLLRWLYLYLFVYYICWFSTATFTRYALPIIPILDFLTMFVFSQMIAKISPRAQTASWATFKIVLLIFVWLNILLFTFHNSGTIQANIGRFWGKIDDYSYYKRINSPAEHFINLGNSIKIYEKGQPSNVDSHRSDKVFMVFTNLGYPLGRNGFTDTFYTNLLLLMDRTERGEDPIIWLRQKGYKYLIFNERRIEWLRNPSRNNSMLNPSKDASLLLEKMVKYWLNEIRPQLQPISSSGSFQLYAIPESISCNHNSKPTELVMLAILDSVRADHTSLCGYPRPTTPFLESLAKSNEFNITCNAYAPASWTLPSHASYFTGLGVQEHGAHNSPNVKAMYDWGGHTHPLNQKFETLAESYKKKGFITVLVSANPIFDQTSGLDQGFDIKRVASICGQWYDQDFLSPLNSALFEAKRSQKPIFLFVNIMDAHAPWKSVPESVEWISATQGLKFARDESSLFTRFVNRQLSKEESQEFITRYKNVYDFGISRADTVLENTIETLKTHGFQQFPLIITSDHGELLGENQAVGHGATVWEPNIRVPFLYRSKNVAPVTFPNPMSTQDLHHIMLYDSIPQKWSPVVSIAGPDKTWQGVTKNMGHHLYIGFWEKNRKWIWEDEKFFVIENYLQQQENEIDQLAQPQENPPEILKSILLKTQKSFRRIPEKNEELLEKLRALGYVQ